MHVNVLYYDVSEVPSKINVNQVAAATTNVQFLCLQVNKAQSR